VSPEILPDDIAALRALVLAVRAELIRGLLTPRRRSPTPS
jgi:hypothetical protein